MAERIVPGERPDKRTSDGGTGQADKRAASSFSDLHRQYERDIQRAQQAADLPHEYVRAAGQKDLSTRGGSIGASADAVGVHSVSSNELLFVEAKAWERAQNDVATRGGKPFHVELPAGEALGKDVAARLQDTFQRERGEAHGQATVLVEFDRLGDLQEWRAQQALYGVAGHRLELVDDRKLTSAETAEPAQADRSGADAREGLSRKRAAELFDRGTPVEGGRAWFEADDPTLVAAKNLRGFPGTRKYDLHGRPTDVTVSGNALTPTQFADVVRADPDWKNQDITLFSCETGQLRPDGSCFAQELADNLGVPVTAPTELAWSNGEPFSSSGYEGNFGMLKPTMPPDGSFRQFHPRSSRHRRGGEAS